MISTSPRVVLGVPMYQSEDFVVEAMECLLAQSYDDFAVVAIDDCSRDSTLDVVRNLTRGDARVVVETNSHRLGSCGNWNRVLARALELYPDCELFAWASDNDLREPAWLSAAVKALDENPAAVLAYSRGGSVVDGVRLPPPAEPVSDAPPAESGVDRMSAVVHGRQENAMFYGLQRVHALRRVGGKPPVLFPDFLLLSCLALHGEFARCPDGLWYRGPRTTGGSRRRQRAALFSGRAPLWAWLPVPIQHAGWLTRALVTGSGRPPGFGRTRAVAAVGRFCLEVARQLIRRRWSRLRKQAAKTLLWARKRRYRAKKRAILRLKHLGRFTRRRWRRVARFSTRMRISR
jgi:glycosyltransferase involved in cell wall biosynthesis